MAAARNPGISQGLPPRPTDTGLTYARRLERELAKADRLSPGPSYEFEVPNNQRVYPRLPLLFPLRVQRVADDKPLIAEPLFTQNISSTGVFFLAPIQVAPESPIELEIGLTDRPRGPERVRMCARAHVVRVTPVAKPGWFAVAVKFDEISFDRDERG